MFSKRKLTILAIALIVIGGGLAAADLYSFYVKRPIEAYVPGTLFIDGQYYENHVFGSLYLNETHNSTTFEYTLKYDGQKNNQTVQYGFDDLPSGLVAYTTLDGTPIDNNGTLVLFDEVEYDFSCTIYCPFNCTISSTTFNHYIEP